MSGRNLFRKIVRNFLCLTAALLTFTACAYTDYRLWPLDLEAPRYPALPAPKFQGNRLALPFAPGIASVKSPRFTTSSKPSCILSICAAAKPAMATIPRASC